MTDFEKIEKLRQHANVSFEEAKKALEEAGGDILDAMILLERTGKAKGPAESTHSTKYEDQKDYVSVDKTVKQSREEEHKVKSTVVGGLKRIWRFLTENYFVVSRDEREIVVLPLLVVLIILICLFFASIIALVVLLFLGFRYSFRGKNKLDKTNDYLNKAADAASDLAGKVKEEFR